MLFTFFERKLSERKNDALRYFVYSKVSFLKFILNGNRFEACLAIHKFNLASHSVENCYNFRFNINDSLSFLYMTFKKTMFTFLKAPYLTNCFDYEKNGYFSQENCLQKCENKRIHNFSKVCKHIDCEVEYFSTISSYAVNFDSNTSMFVKAPFLETTQYLFSPHFNVIDLIVYLSGTVNLWFGISIYAMLVEYQKLPKIIFLTLKRKRRIPNLIYT